MPDINALYPQPPAPASGLLNGDPMKNVGVFHAINQNALLLKQMPALAQQSAAALQGQNISNATAQLEQDAMQTKIIAAQLSALDPAKATPDLIHNHTVSLSRAFPNITTSKINTIADIALNDPQGLKHGLATLRNIGLSSDSASARVTGAPSPDGAATTVPLATANYSGTTSTAPSGSIATSLPPGEAGVLEQSSNRASQLQSTAATTGQYHADLENLKQDSNILDNLGGPTFDVEKKLNQLSTRLGGIGVTMSPEQLKAGESFDKIASQISRQQGQFFGDTDATRNMSVGANPSTSQSAYGREGIIDMLQGNQDAIDRVRDLWLSARANGAPANSHDVFMNKISKEIDPRVFQFNRMSRENQQIFLHHLNPEDIGDFESKYQMSINNGWVKPLKKVANASK